MKSEYATEDRKNKKLINENSIAEYYEARRNFLILLAEARKQKYTPIKKQSYT